MIEKRFHHIPEEEVDQLRNCLEKFTSELELILSLSMDPAFKEAYAENDRSQIDKEIDNIAVGQELLEDALEWLNENYPKAEPTEIEVE